MFLNDWFVNGDDGFAIEPATFVVDVDRPVFLNHSLVNGVSRGCQEVRPVFESADVGDEKEGFHWFVII